MRSATGEAMPAFDAVRGSGTGKAAAPPCAPRTEQATARKDGTAMPLRATPRAVINVVEMSSPPGRRPPDDTRGDG